MAERPRDCEGGHKTGAEEEMVDDYPCCLLAWPNDS